MKDGLSVTVILLFWMKSCTNFYFFFDLGVYFRTEFRIGTFIKSICWFSLEIHNFSSPFFSFSYWYSDFSYRSFFNPKIRLILRLTQTVFVKFQGNKSLQKTIRIDFVMYFPLLTLTMHSRKKIFSCYMQKFIETLAPIIYTNPRWFWLSYPFRLFSMPWKIS